MTRDQMMRPLQRLYDEVINKCDMDVIDELYGPGYVNHLAPFGLSSGVSGLKILFGEFASAFPDQHIAADTMHCIDDLVIARWTITGTHKNAFFNLEPTDRKFTMTGVDIERIDQGLIVEHWGAEDMLALLQDIGAIEVPNIYTKED